MDSAKIANQMSHLLRSPDLSELLSLHPHLQIEQDSYNINVTANYGTRLSPQETLQKYINHNGEHKPAHLYFHLPLCSYICHFCNYVKRLLPRQKSEEELDRWTNLLISESKLYLSLVPWLPKATIESFFIGGGTASLLRPKHLAQVLEHVYAWYSLTDDCELTLEGNPDNFVEDEVKVAKELGFNRFSVGVQSFQTEVNKFAGRGHDADTSLRAIHKLLESGCPFNVDMMFGLPYQTPETVAKDIQTLVSLKAPTITIYRLRNVDRAQMGIGNRATWNVSTVRDRLHREGLFPSLQEVYAMRAITVETLLSHNYHPSPCGWWSAPDTYPEGNIPRVSRNKWQRYDTMIAFGPGAYGWLTGGEPYAVQTHNIADISAYANHLEAGGIPPLAFGRLLEGQQAVATALGFAFKANQPISIKHFNAQYGVELLTQAPYQAVIAELTQRGFLQITKDHQTLIPTLDGEALHEEIISYYFHNQIGAFSEAVCHKGP